MRQSDLISQLDTVLSSWRHWRVPLKAAPEVLEQLPKGRTNLNFRLRTSQGDAVLRLDNEQSVELGIDRQRESVIVESLANANLHPRYWVFDAVNGFAVRAWIEGESKSALDLEGREKVALRRLLDSVAAVPIDLPEFDYVGHLTAYFERAKASSSMTASLSAAWPEFIGETQRWQAQVPRGLTHHDLAGENIITTNGSITLIDWEYSGLGSPILDQIAAGFVPNVGNLAQVRQAMFVADWMDKLWSVLRG